MPINSNFVASGDVFGTRVFIENRGQFKILATGEKIDYVYQHGGEKIYFTTKGLVYELNKESPGTEEEREAAEKRREPIAKKINYKN